MVIGFFVLLFPQVYEKIASENELRISSIPNTQNAKSASASASIQPNEPIRIAPELLKETVSYESPMRIVIPTIGIDIPIIDARVINGYWELSETTASYGLGSSHPGHIGNTVIFAHARKGLFLPLRDVAVGSSVYLLTSNRWYRYNVMATKLVLPTDIQEVSSTDDQILTLFTCSGFLDSKRLIVTAKPVR